MEDESKSECYICYKLFDNSDQRNYCLQLHPVCKNCLGRWIFKLQNDSCPVCRSRINFEDIRELQYVRHFAESYREYCCENGIDSIRYLFGLVIYFEKIDDDYILYWEEWPTDGLKYLFESNL